MGTIFRKERIGIIFWSSAFAYLYAGLLSIFFAHYFGISYVWWLHGLWKKLFSFLDVWPPG